MVLNPDYTSILTITKKNQNNLLNIKIPILIDLNYIFI